MVQEFYANAWITKNHDQSMNPNPKNWLTIVWGKYLDFSPETVRLAFNLPIMRGDSHPFTRRVNFDQRLDQVDVWKTIQHKTHRQVYRVASSNNNSHE